MTAFDRQKHACGALAIATCLISLGLATRSVAQDPAAPPIVPNQPIRVGLPVPQFTQTGELVVRPNVSAGTGAMGGAIVPPGMPAGYAPAVRSPVPRTSYPPVGSAPAQANLPTAPVDPFVNPATAPQIGIQPVQPAGATFFQPAPEPVPAPPMADIPFSLNPESLPAPQPSEGPGWFDGSKIGNLLGGDPNGVWGQPEPLIPWEDIGNWCKHCMLRQTSPTGEAGLGRERVMFAPFEIDITQPQGNFLWRTDAAYNLGFPNRSEYFWSLPGRGPAPERGVDYVDHRFRFEFGGGAFSLATEVPIRQLNPEINENTNGVGDIQLVQKTVIIDGSRWQMTQLLRTTFNNGNARKGLGTGHVSMEPGMLWRWKYNELTYYHSELKMTFPIAGDPMGASPILKWGIGMSTIYYETDTIAYMPTLEFTNLWFLDGQRTTYPDGVRIDIDADGVLLLTPGLRMVCDTGGDLGIVELGASMPIQLGDDGWYNYLFRFDLRFVF